MVDQLSRVYAALADPTRRGIVERLSRGDTTVATLRAPLTVSAPAVSKHLRVLEAAGVITRHKSGRNQVCTLRRSALVDAQHWFADQMRFWTGTLDSLDRYLEDQA